MVWMVIGGWAVTPATGVADSKFAYTLVVEVMVEDEGAVIVLLTSITLFSPLEMDGATSIAMASESTVGFVSFLKLRGSFFESSVSSSLV